MHTATKRRTAIALLVAVALAVPTSASAATADQLLPSSAAGDSAGGAGPTLPTLPAEPESSGFDWGDAGLGAAGMLSLFILGAGAVGISRRARRPAPTG
jgi:hypothetical protein